MRKTASEIEADIYKILSESDLLSKVNGKLYREGLRPLDSQKEDVIINFLTGIDTDFYQKGRVNINIYVPNKTTQGPNRKDIKRCTEVERALLDFLENLSVRADYKFKASRMIQAFEEPKINQHFINLQVEFQYNVLT